MLRCCSWIGSSPPSSCRTFCSQHKGRLSVAGRGQQLQSVIVIVVSKQTLQQRSHEDPPFDFPEFVFQEKASTWCGHTTFFLLFLSLSFYQLGSFCVTLLSWVYVCTHAYNRYIKLAIYKLKDSSSHCGATNDSSSHLPHLPTTSTLTGTVLLKTSVSECNHRNITAHRDTTHRLMS